MAGAIFLVLGIAVRLSLADGDAQVTPPVLSPRVHLPAAFRAPPADPTPTVTPQPREWDPRLDQRGAVLMPAQVQPGQGYWRLIKGVWYAENEPPVAGLHHIFVDVVDTAGDRRVGVPFRVTSLDGVDVFAEIATEAKPGELYAANFPMYAVAPAYRVELSDGQPADGVTGLGLGSIEAPGWMIHTSYGFVWQWSVAPAAVAPGEWSLMTAVVVPEPSAWP